MFILGKILTYSLLSPGLFIILLIVLLAAILSDHRRTSIFLVILSGCTIYLLSVKPVRDKIVRPLEFRYQQVQNPDLDVIIVLGGGVRNTFGKSVLTDPTMQRVYYAHQLYQKKKVPIIVCGGAPLGRNARESTVMKEVLLSLNVPKEKIYEENQSRNTYENLYNTKIYLQKYGYKKPGLVTSALHTPRAMRTAAALGIKITALPCDYKYEGSGYHWEDFFPNTSNLRDSFAGLKEYIGTTYYLKALLR